MLTIPAMYAQADLVSNISPEFSKCQAKFDTNVYHEADWIACNEAELARLDPKLNDVYKQVLKAMPPEEKKTMTQAQRDWLKFRESTCKLWAVQNLRSPLGQHGYTTCMVEMTDKRISDLRDWVRR